MSEKISGKTGENKTKKNFELPTHSIHSIPDILIKEYLSIPITINLQNIRSSVWLTF